MQERKIIKGSDKKGNHREKDNIKDKRQIYGSNIGKHTGGRDSTVGAGAKDSPRLLARRPMITMRGPTLSSIEGEVELLNAL